MERSFQALATRLEALLDALRELRTIVVEDRPLCGDVVLVDLFGNSADDLAGWSGEALASAHVGAQALRTGNYAAARQALTDCQECTGRAARSLLGDLLAYERIAELVYCGRSRGGEWRGWARCVKQALEGCRQPLFDIEQAQLACWQDLAEGAARTAR